MEEVVLTLRHSTENEKRGAVMARLRYLQEQQPQSFLSSSWEWISSPQRAGEDRFFMATLVLSFVKDSWRSWEADKNTKGAILQKYIELALNEYFSSELLCRKIGSIIAVMAKFGPKSSEPGMLPPYIQKVVDAYLASLQQLSPSSSSAMMNAEYLERASQTLLLLHVFLKEVQIKRVGKVFEKVSQYIAPLLLEALRIFPFSAFSSKLEYIFALRGLKCAYRVFGSGCFHPTFCSFMLQQAWEAVNRARSSIDASTAVRGFPTTEGSYTRPLDYVLKTFQKLFICFSFQLHQLPPDFFIPSDASLVGTSCDRSLLYFLFSVILSCRKDSVNGELISEKSVCRSISIFTLSFTTEESDSYVKEYLKRFTMSPLLAPLMETIITRFLADDCSSEVVRQWDTNPERGVEELEMDCDDELSPVSCAEQLFLGLTGSEENAAICLNVAWAIVKNLLTEGQEVLITAALHAVGIGYYTMRNNSDYLSFLEFKLLPILQNATTVVASTTTGESSAVSVAVLRRVIWMVGMWCESVPEMEQRRQVHNALASVLVLCTPSSPGRGLMLALVALRSVENFVSDENFTVEELQPPALLESILQTIALVLPQLRSPSVVSQQVGFLYVLMEKGCIPAPGGNTVITLVLPTAQGLVDEIQNKSSLPSLVGEKEAEDDDNAGKGEPLKMSVVLTLLECLRGAVTISSGTAEIWELLPVVLACTHPEGVLAAYVEEEAWELLLIMARYSQVYVPRMNEAIRWCLLSVSRDFSSLSVVWSCISTLVLCNNLPAEHFFSAEQVIEWLHTYSNVCATEVCSSFLAFFLTLMVQSHGPLRSVLAERSLCTLALWSDDVQCADQPLQLALLVAIGLKDASNVALQAQLRQIVETSPTANRFSPSCEKKEGFSISPAPDRTTSSSPTAEQGDQVDFVEKILLLLDVASNLAYTLALHALLRVILENCSIQNPSILEAVRLALQKEVNDNSTETSSSTVEAAQASVEYVDLYEETEEEQKERALREVTASTTIPSSTMHYQRLLQRFHSILFCD